MEKLRNIISNLYIYRFQNNNNNNNNNNFNNNINNVSNINPINFSGNDDLADDYEIINNLNIIKKPTNYNNQNKNNFNSNNNTLTINNKYSNTLEKPFQSLKSENIDIYNNKDNNKKFIAKEKIKEEILNNNNNHFMIKSGINYVVRNKKLLKEKEWKMREERLKKENEALHLLLSHKPKPHNVRSKLFDYQEKQSKIKKVGNLNNRSHSSNGNKKLINGIKKYNLYYNNNENIENNENEIVLNNYDLKYYKNLAGNLILPKIKPETSPLANIQEKDESVLKESINEKNSMDKENNNNDNNQIIKDDFEEKINDIKKTLQQQNKSDKFMTEEEKKEKMNELNLRKKDLEIELFKLPIARLSKRQIERKSEIEKSLDNIDYELNKLSYVKIPLKI